MEKQPLKQVLCKIGSSAIKKGIFFPKIITYLNQKV